MKTVYNIVGERKSCLTLSNLGNIEMPDEMRSFVKRMDFILGTQATTTFNCGMLSYNGTLYMNFVRKCIDPLLEREFFEVLRDAGLEICVESNNGSLELENKN